MRSRSLVFASLLGIFSVSIVACTAGSAESPVASGGAAATRETEDRFARSFEGVWERVGFISKRKEYPSITFHKNGAYDATRNDESQEHGAFAASAEDKTVTLTPDAGEARTFKVYITAGQELHLALTGEDATQSDDVEVFLFKEPEPVEQPDVPGSGVDVACEARTGGAFITIETAGKPYKVWSTNAQFIERAKFNLDMGVSKVAHFTKIYKGTDCDSGIKLYPDPEAMSWTDATPEVCDAEPEWLNDNIDYMVDTVKSWCPWHAQVTAVDER